MNSEKGKTSDLHRLLLNLTDKIISKKNVALLTFSSKYAAIIKKIIQNQ